MPEGLGTSRGEGHLFVMADAETSTLCACSEADREAFVGWVGRLVHAHRGRLLALARREGLGAEDAFDAVQEAFGTFLTMPAARDLVEAAEDSRKLLMAITRNLARNRRRLAATALKSAQLLGRRIAGIVRALSGRPMRPTAAHTCVLGHGSPPAAITPSLPKTATPPLPGPWMVPRPTSRYRAAVVPSARMTKAVGGSLPAADHATSPRPVEPSPAPTT